MVKAPTTAHAIAKLLVIGTSSQKLEVTLPCYVESVKRDAQLDAAGLSVAADPAVRDECIRVAGRLRATGKSIFGLLPAGDDVAVPPIGVQLGLALAEVSGATVAFVDANLR